MPKLFSESLVISLILLHMATYTISRPRRRFCEHFPFAPRCLGIAAKRDLRGRLDMPVEQNEKRTTLDAVERILMEKSGLDAVDTYDYGERWNDGISKDEQIDEDFSSNFLKKIIKRQSVNTDIISQERMPAMWFTLHEKK